MKAIIKKTTWIKEYETKFGLLNQHRIEYENKAAYYSSKQKEQSYFTPGKEADFTEEERSGKNGTYLIIKPIRQGNYSNFGKQLKKEQSRYTTMGASYVKDLIIAGKIDVKKWEAATEKIVKFMYNLDKQIES